MLILHPEDKDIVYKNEYEPLIDVYYKGEKFTGALKNEWEYTEYKEGVAHGQAIEYDASGKVWANHLYEQGTLVKSLRYFENGKLQSETLLNPLAYRAWNLDGILIRDNKTTYYKDGPIKMIVGDPKKDDFQRKAFAKNGEVLYTILKDIWVNGKLERPVEYQDSILLENYFDALIEENPKLADSQEKNDSHYIWMWFWTVFDKDSRTYFEIINRLMTHPELQVKKDVASIIASHKFHDYITKETEATSECYALIKEYTQYQDSKFPNREVKKVKV